VLSFTGPAWRFQSRPIEQRTCGHLRRLRGDQAEQARVGQLTTGQEGARCLEERVRKSNVAKSSSMAGMAIVNVRPPTVQRNPLQGTVLPQSELDFPAFVVKPP
jgi:hypothetical protein